MDEDDKLERMLAGSNAGGYALIVVVPIGLLWFFYPLVWAIVVCGLLVMGFGLVTAKLLGVRGRWRMLAVAPVLGGIWVGFFYVLMEVVG